MILKQILLDDGATMLLINRKRIIHKAKDKLTKLVALLKNIKDLKYTFIYVPEGKERDYSKDEDYQIPLIKKMIE